MIVSYEKILELYIYTSKTKAEIRICRKKFSANDFGSHSFQFNIGIVISLILKFVFKLKETFFRFLTTVNKIKCIQSNAST